MTATLPLLAGWTLPDPYEFEEGYYFPGSTVQMADATQHRELVRGVALRTWLMKWKALTAAFANGINNAYNNIAGTSGVFRDMDNAYFAARWDGPMELVTIPAAQATDRYDVMLRLREKPGVIIRYIDYDPPGDDIADAGSNIQLYNADVKTWDLTGWMIHDLVGLRYTIPAFTLAAGATVTVYTKSGSDTATELYMNRGTAIWNNTGGDTGFLYDAESNEQSRYEYEV